MEALASSAACVLMIGVLAVALIGRDRGKASDGELEQLRQDLTELRQQRPDREAQP